MEKYERSEKKFVEEVKHLRTHLNRTVQERDQNLAVIQQLKEERDLLVSENSISKERTEFDATEMATLKA